MHQLLALWPVFAVLIVILVAVGAMKAMARSAASGQSTTDDDPPGDFDGYRRKRDLFSQAEYSFYKVLAQTVGAEFSIQAKVRIADVIEVQRGSAHWQRKFNQINRKHLDFILCEPKTMVPMLAIELDDSSHDGEDRKKRDVLVDGVMKAAGMPLLRVVARRGYAPQGLRAEIEKAMVAVPL